MTELMKCVTSSGVIQTDVTIISLQMSGAFILYVLNKIRITSSNCSRGDIISVLISKIIFDKPLKKFS